ncbi:hypothetical protein Trydic_g17992 [Trypoxylus dichotomus]
MKCVGVENATTSVFSLLLSMLMSRKDSQKERAQEEKDDARTEEFSKLETRPTSAHENDADDSDEDDEDELTISLGKLKQYSVESGDGGDGEAEEVELKDAGGRAVLYLRRYGGRKPWKLILPVLLRRNGSSVATLNVIRWK